MTAQVNKEIQPSKSSGFFSTISANIVMAGINFLTGMLLARLLGPEGRGELAAIQTWPTFIAILAHIGLTESIVYFSAKYPDQSKRLVTTTMLIVAFVSIPFAVIGYLILPYLLASQSAEVIASSRLYLFLIPIYIIIYIPLHALRGIQELKIWNLLRMSPSLVWLATIFIGIVNQSSASELVIIFLIGQVLLAIPLNIIVFSRLSGLFWPDFSFSRQLLNYGIPSVLSTIPTTLNLRLDQMLMAAFLSAEFLGIYVVGVAWSSAVAPLATAIGTIILPKIAGDKNKASQISLFSQASRLGLFSIIGITVFIASLSGLMIPLIFGSNFGRAVPIAVMLCIAAGIRSYGDLLKSGLMGLGFPKYVLGGETVGLVATLLFLPLFLQIYELMGAALASLIAYSITTVFFLYISLRETNTPLVKFIALNDSDWKLLQGKYKQLIVRSL